MTCCSVAKGQAWNRPNPALKYLKKLALYPSSAGRSALGHSYDGLHQSNMEIFRIQIGEIFGSVLI